MHILLILSANFSVIQSVAKDLGDIIYAYIQLVR